MTQMTINGERVRQAREIRGLTQAELARLIEVNQSNVARMEAGELSPALETLESISLHTDFPLSFFERNPGPDFPLGSLLFRQKSKLRSSERSQVRQLARLMFELFEQVLGKFRPYEVGIPRLSETPQLAAKITRSALGYSPDAPVPDLVRRLERNGVVVIALPYPIKDHDAFSLWADTEPRKPVVVVTAGKPGDRMRFSIAHELGHLVLHRGAEGSRSELENQADEFASEFLMPREAIKKELIPPITLSSLVELKKRWGVSMQALVVRSRDLQVITERQYKYLFQQMGSHGWRVEEPVHVPAERPRLLRKMIEVIYGPKFDVASVAGLVGAPMRLLEQALDCYEGPPGHHVQTRADSNKVIQFRPGLSSGT